MIKAITKIGNSQGIIFDSALMELAHLKVGDEKSAYGVSGRYIFRGKWIRHCTQYPYPQVRLVKVGIVS